MYHAQCSCLGRHGPHCAFLQLSFPAHILMVFEAISALEALRKRALQKFDQQQAVVPKFNPIKGEREPRCTQSARIRVCDALLAQQIVSCMLCLACLPAWLGNAVKLGSLLQDECSCCTCNIDQRVWKTCQLQYSACVMIRSIGGPEACQASACISMGHICELRSMYYKCCKCFVLLSNRHAHAVH